jgi:hypothetical protein
MAVKIRPNCPDVRNLLVVILFRRGNEYFEKAVEEARKLEALLDLLSQKAGEKNTFPPTNVTYINGRRNVLNQKLPSARGIASSFYRLSLPLSKKVIIVVI